MVLLADPILQTLKKLKRKNSHVVVFTPRGKQLTSARARQMASLPHLILVCGHYEEIDQRFYQMSGAEEISIGDYVLSGGEIPALVLIDAVSRFVPGVVGKTDSVIQDSFENGLLDYPHYTRPAKYKGEKVPAELMSGNHKAIECYRRKAALRQTLFRRPDLFAKAKLNQTDRKLLQEIILE
jgi:tRNA (guanine37-N1)-methyltransferase